MAAIDFPNSPTLNQEFTANGRTWIWNGTVWANKTSNTSVSRYNVSDTAPSSPASGDVWFNSTNARTYVYYDSFWVESNPALDGKSGVNAVASPITNSGTQSAAVLGLDYNSLQYGQNAVINGAFDIWQRGATFNSIATYTYFADRWTTGAVFSPGVMSITRESLSPGSVSTFGTEFQYFARFTRTTTGPAATYMGQKIEDVRTFAGKTVTLSYWAKVSTGTLTVPRVFLNQQFGTGGSTEVDNLGATAPVYTTTWTRFTQTINVPSISGKTLGTGHNLWILWQFPDDGNYTIDITGVQLELGSTATPFKRNAPSIQGELAACQRYCIVYGGNKLYERAGTGSSDNSTTLRSATIFPVQMRSTPTFSYSALGDWQAVLPGIVGVIPTSMTLSTDESSPTVATLTVNFSSNGNFGSSKSAVLCANGTLNAKAIFSSEL